MSISTISTIEPIEPIEPTVAEAAGIGDGVWRAVGPKLAAVFDAVETPLALLSPEFRHVAVNAAYATLADRTADDLIGDTVFEVFVETASTGPEASYGDLHRSLTEVLGSGRTHVVPALCAEVLDGDVARARFWQVTNSAIHAADGQVEFILLNPREIAGRSEGDEGLARSAASAGPRLGPSDDGATFTAAMSRLQQLNDLASSLVGASTPAEVGRAAMRDGLGLIGASSGLMLTVDGTHLDIVAAHSIRAGIIEQWSRIDVTAGAEPFSDTVLDGEPLFFPTRADLIDRYPHLEGSLAGDDEAFAVLPLRHGDVVSGAIGVVFAEPTPFDTPLRLVMYTLANLVSQAASRAQLLIEQSIALQSIDDVFHFRLDPVEGLETTALYRPATLDTRAGGDWYDVISLTPSSTLILIADVADHGAHAIGDMVRARSTIHAIAFDEHGPAAICERVDRVMARLASTHATAVIAVFDHRTAMLTWTTAGHPFPMLCGHDGVVEILAETHGAPLGVGIGGFRSGQRRLDPGDTIVLYTDGLIEARDTTLDHGFDTLRRTLLGMRAGDRHLATKVYDAFHANGRHNDDIAILTVHVPAPAAERRH